MNKCTAMSDTPSNNHQSNEDDNSNPLAKAFFDKLRKDGPKRDKVGQAYVRHISVEIQNPLGTVLSKSDEISNDSDVFDEEENKPSGARMLWQLRAEIRKDVAEIRKQLDSNSADPTNEK